MALLQICTMLLGLGLPSPATLLFNRQSHIPLRSTVVVQREDGRPWTHGTVVNTGDHNHHDRSYIVQLTMTGKQITRNRHHIKPTNIITDSYIQHHTNRHHIRTTDPH